MKKFSLEEVRKFGTGFEIIPAILDLSIDDVKEKVSRVRGKTSRIGVDIIDGIYVDNLTIGVEDLVDVDWGGAVVEAQLMTEYPEELLGSCHTVGVKRAYGHIEKMGSQEEYLELCRELSVEPGFGLDIFTPVESIDKGLLEKLDGVLLMGVRTGYSGQKFMPAVLDKIQKLRELGYEKDIQIDGGINPETMKVCVEAGANHFSVTSFMWKHSSVDAALDELKLGVGVA